MSRMKYAIVFALALVMALGAMGVASAAVPSDSSQLRKAVKAAGILKHERELQDIADANNDTRASGTRGYNASARYVAGKLRNAGYNVTIQPFEFPFFQELEDATFSRTAPTAETYVLGTDFATMEYSGSGNVENTPVQAVDLVLPPTPAPSSSSGCETSDFANFVEGSVALIQRGTCDFAVKAANAEVAGASAVIIFNEGQEGRTDLLNGTLGAPDVTIPVIGTTFEVGNELASLSGARVSISTSTLSETRTTRNVIADYPGGRADRTVVVGAHLDSVLEGPGINDNGSGTSTILEIALQMRKLKVKPTNHVRFAFWGAEESGLLGSEYYVGQLSEKQLQNIAVNLNFDMVGSPNYVRFVYDGDGSDTPQAGPPGSAQVEQVFNDYFASQGLETDPTAFDGRSDYGPFIDAGIPAGGLFSGAEGVKSDEQAAIYGGVAGEAYDPCYHQACDSLTPVEDGADAALYDQLATEYKLVGNLNVRALNEMADGAAHATLTFAQTASPVDGTAKATAKSGTDLEFAGSHARK